MGAVDDKNKGYDLILDAFKKLEKKHGLKNIKLIIFGGEKPKDFNLNKLQLISLEMSMMILHCCIILFSRC